MSRKVIHIEAEAFHAAHASEQHQLAVDHPDQTLQARLRPYFPVSFNELTTIFYVEQDNQVIGIAECIQLEDPAVLTLSYVTVDERYRNQGFASTLVSAIVQYMRERGQNVLDSSYYTESGDQHLKKVLRRVGDQGVQLIENGIPFTASHRAMRL